MTVLTAPITRNHLRAAWGCFNFKTDALKICRSLTKKSCTQDRDTWCLEQRSTLKPSLASPVQKPFEKHLRHPICYVLSLHISLLSLNPSISSPSLALTFLPIPLRDRKISEENFPFLFPYYLHMTPYSLLSLLLLWINFRSQPLAPIRGRSSGISRLSFVHY